MRNRSKLAVDDASDSDVSTCSCSTAATVEVPPDSDSELVCTAHHKPRNEGRRAPEPQDRTSTDHLRWTLDRAQRLQPRDTSSGTYKVREAAKEKWFQDLPTARSRTRGGGGSTRRLAWNGDLAKRQGGRETNRAQQYQLLEHYKFVHHKKRRRIFPSNVRQLTAPGLFMRRTLRSLLPQSSQSSCVYVQETEREREGEG
jgi:hypothetical protein